MLAGCNDAFKAIARWDILEYTSTFLGDQCNITSEALMLVPETPLVACMATLDSKSYNTSSDICSSVEDYVACVR